MAGRTATPSSPVAVRRGNDRVRQFPAIGGHGTMNSLVQGSNHKRLVLALMLVGLLAAVFWTQSRYPALDEKAMMSGAIQLEDPIGFEAKFPVTRTCRCRNGIVLSTLNWINTNKKGMTFGVLIAAAFLTLFGYLRKRSFAGRVLQLAVRHGDRRAAGGLRELRRADRARAVFRRAAGRDDAVGDDRLADAEHRGADDAVQPAAGLHGADQDRAQPAGDPGDRAADLPDAARGAVAESARDRGARSHRLGPRPATREPGPGAGRLRRQLRTEPVVHHQDDRAPDVPGRVPGRDGGARCCRRR